MKVSSSSIGFLLITIFLESTVLAVPFAKIQEMGDFGFILIETDQKYNWYEAANECAIKNMTLIAVDTAAKNAALIKILSDNTIKVNLWIGGNDLGHEGRFVWSSTGKPFTFSNWSKGNPDNYDNGNCVDIWDTTNFEWNDANCNSNIGFICEENAFLVASTSCNTNLQMRKQIIEQVLSTERVLDQRH